MSDQNNSSNLLGGLIIGAAIGAGITLLFGTKKGKEIRQKIQDEYPDVFENLEDKFSEVVDRIEEIKGEVSDTALGKVEELGAVVEDLGVQLKHVSRPKRFVKSGKKL